MEMARDLGRALGRTDEYRALEDAVRGAEEDRELEDLRDRLQALEEQLESRLRAGKEPEREVLEEFEKVFGQVQENPAYQRLVAAQTNFDKVLARVDEAVQKGMEEGAENRIVLSP